MSSVRSTFGSMVTGLAMCDDGILLTVFWTMVESCVLSLRSEAAAEVAVNCSLFIVHIVTLTILIILLVAGWILLTASKSGFCLCLC